MRTNESSYKAGCSSVFTMPAVNIIGAGRVGRTFLSLLGSDVRHVASRTLEAAEQSVSDTGYGRAVSLESAEDADFWLLTVPDCAITDVATALAAMGRAPATAVHCSGFHRAEVMAPLKEAGWDLASAHPNLSFADPAVAATRFAGTPCGIEGDPAAVEKVEDLVRSIGGTPFRISSDQKVLYHAAAVFSNNFATVLQAVARDAWRDAGVPEAMLDEIHASLLTATVENVLKAGPRDALTGPAARGDCAVVADQAEAVTAWHKDAGQIYRMLSAMAAELKASGKY